MIAGEGRRASAPFLFMRGFLLVRGIWLSAVAGDASIRFNLRLLTALTALFSLPEFAQGVAMASQGTTGSRLYGAYVLLLSILEMGGAGLLALRRPGGCWLIGAAAVGFYPEAMLGLAGFERTLLSAAIFAACVPAEAWVLWFVAHPRTQAYMRQEWKGRSSVA